MPDDPSEPAAERHDTLDGRDLSHPDLDNRETGTQPIEPGWARLKLVVAVGAIVIVIDQLTKAWAVAALDDGPVELFWTLRFRLIYNTGFSFGLGSGLGRWLALIVALVVVAVLNYASRCAARVIRVLLGAVVGGAIGNVVDRLARADDGLATGGVVDFVDLQWWPVFNVADMAVVCGGLGLALLSLHESRS